MRGVTFRGGRAEDEFQFVAVRADEGDPPFQFLAA